MSAYSPPIDQLLHLGWTDEKHPIASRFGLTAEHIPDLVQMATDKDLWVDCREPESWGMVHALNALAELGAIDRLPRLLDFISEMDHEELTGDWVTEEMTDWLLAFGPDTAPLLKAELQRSDRTIWIRSATARALRRWAGESPERRAEVIEAICSVLDRRDNPDPELNGLLLAPLLDMKATEAAPVIERAFADKLIDIWSCGDWPDVRYELGLGPKPPPRRNSFAPSPYYGDLANRPGNPKERAEQRKAKRKAAKRAHKRNRARR